jgi:CheY-like chemotaxis protein
MPGHVLVIDDSSTVLKVIELALLQSGYRVLAASDDDAALKVVREARIVPDLILLDDVIPNRDAAEICRRFAADPTLAHVPVVVMAARGQSEEFEARFARASNVVDRIGKPFSPDALQAVVAHVVARRTSGAVPGAPAAVDEREGSGAASVRGAVDEALSRSADSSTVAEARAFAASGQALAGDLKAIGMSEIIELLAVESRSGILRVVNTDINARVELYFNAGHIDFAAAVGVAEEFLFGRFLVHGGDITTDMLAEVLASRSRATGPLSPFGADLVSRGLISAEARTRAMIRQASELAYETLRWRAGFFQFRLTDKLPSLAREATLGLSVERLLLEGYRRVDEWQVIEREIASFDEVFVRDDDKIAQMPRGTFTRDELAVLSDIDGRQTVRDIVRKLRMGSFDVSKIIFRLRRARFVRRRLPPVEGR